MRIFFKGNYIHVWNKAVTRPTLANIELNMNYVPSTGVNRDRGGELGYGGRAGRDTETKCLSQLEPGVPLHLHRPDPPRLTVGASLVQLSFLLWFYYFANSFRYSRGWRIEYGVKMFKYEQVPTLDPEELVGTYYIILK